MARRHHRGHSANAVRIIVRTFLALALLLQAWAASAAVTGRRVVHAPVTSAQFATVTVPNTSGSTQAAGGWTPQFGWVFDEGRIPAGTAPILKDGTTPQPYCWGGQTYWPDGSLRHASFIVRLTNSVAGSASKSLAMFNGGAAPSSSSRTLTEVYAQSFQINATGAGSNFGLSGNWVALLDSPASDSNNWKQSTFLDGDACKEWKVRVHFVPAGGGTPHGQLEADFYVAALTDSGGNLGGFRINYALSQPWADVTSPAKGVRAYSLVQLQYGAGTTINAQQPMTAKAFTWNRAGDVFRTTTSNNYYTGGASQNVVPGFITGAAGGLSSTQLYWARVQSNGDFFLGQNSNGGNTTSLGAGSGTFNPVLQTLWGQRGPWGVDANAKWLYVQGTGSTSADSTLRATVDQTYWKTTKVIPPYDLSILGSVVDNTYTFDYTQGNIGKMEWDTGLVGERPDIGVLPGYTAVYFYTQSVVSEKLTRIHGYAGALFSDDVRDSATGSVLNLTNTSYTGMPASNTAAEYDETGAGGFSLPPAAQIPSAGFSGRDWTHRPSLAPAAYLFFGQPDFLDILVENGADAALSRRTGDRYADGNPYSSTKLVLTYWATSWREMGWSHREWVWAAGLIPNPYYEGSQLWNYFDDSATATAKWPADVSAVRLNSFANTNGYWVPVTNQCGSDCFLQLSPWQRSYNTNAFALNAALRKDANAISFLQNWMGKWLAHVQSVYNGYMNVVYYEQSYLGYDATHTNGAPLISSDDQIMGFGLGGLSPISWTNSGARPFTLAVPDASTGYTVSNGDLIVFPFSGSAPAGGNYPTETDRYIVNVSGQSFALSATLGGSSLPAPTDTNAGLPFTGWYIRPHTLPTCCDWQGINGDSSITANVHGAMNYIKAVLGSGYTTLDTAIADLQTRLTAGSVTFVADPKYFLAGSF